METKDNLTKKDKFVAFVENNYWYFYFGLIAILVFLLFFRLDAAEIALWDESRHGVNAYEMIKNNNYIANYFNGELDYWNLKPPISYWTIILGYKIFGYNAFGFRFFSALSFLIMVVILSVFLYKNCGKLSSLFCVFLFASCYGYFMDHYARAGDADAIFMLFYTIAVISLYKSNEKHWWIYISGLMFSLMFLTKSFHSLTFALVVFFYFLFTKGFKRFKWWELVLFFASALLPIAIWCYARYQFDGLKFLKGMIDYDLLARSSTKIEGNNEFFGYYTCMLFINLGEAIFIVSSAIRLISKIKRKEKYDNLEKLCVISFLSVLLFFAIAQTKHFWYVFPCMIPVSIYGSKVFSDWFKNKEFSKKKNVAIYVCSFVMIAAVLFGLVYVSTIKNKNQNQNFLSAVKVENCFEKEGKLFYEDKSTKNWNQADILCAELNLDAKCTNGGFASFVSVENSYLILSKDLVGGYDLNTFSILFENEYYVLLKN